MVKKESKSERAARYAANAARYRAKKIESGLLPQTVYVFDLDRPAIRQYADALIEARLGEMKQNMIGILPKNGDETK